MTENNQTGSDNDTNLDGEKNSLDNSDSLYEIMKNQDINELIDYIRQSKQGNTGDSLDLSSTFMEHHTIGVDLFFQLAIKLEPENPLHHHNYALYLEHQRSYDLARDEFKTAIELEQTNDVYHSDYGNLLLMLNDFDGAEEQYKSAIEINPDNPKIWANLGVLYSNNNNLDKAEQALKKAISLDPNSTLSYLNLLSLYKRNGKITEAKAVLNKYKNLKLQNLDINILQLD
jgi:Tfp pilus assembly protein PilF